MTPSLRLYSQSAASFYFDPIYNPDPSIGEPFPVGYDPANPNQLISLDQRLSAFGALTLGLKAAYRIDPAWSIDGKIEK